VVTRDSSQLLMIAPKTDPKWAALVKGQLECKFSNPPASMLLWRLKCVLRRDPSPTAVNKAIDEMHAFFSKYENQVQSDLNTIFN
jgi:hypothetical protein